MAHHNKRVACEHRKHARGAHTAALGSLPSSNENAERHFRSSLARTLKPNFFESLLPSCFQQIDNGYRQQNCHQSCSSSLLGCPLSVCESFSIRNIFQIGQLRTGNIHHLEFDKPCSLSQQHISISLSIDRSVIIKSEYHDKVICGPILHVF